jgi:hypothetical protein
MEDLALLAQEGADFPPETRARLEILRRELAEAVQENPVHVANFGITIEHGRVMLQRQVRCALRLLAMRQATVEALEAEVARLQRRRRWWPW